MLEYLAHAGYERTTQQLKNELRERREGKQQNWRPVGRDMQDKVKDRMLRALDRGEREEVLKLWDNFVPPLVRRSDKNAQKLEFYLNIFFAIFPLHPTNPTPQPNNLGAAMRTFKTYLETDGAALAVTPEFLAYYAMPHVTDISRHPSFKELFSAEWGARAQGAACGLFGHPVAEHPVANAGRDLQALKQRLIHSELRAIEAKCGGGGGGSGRGGARGGTQARLEGSCAASLRRRSARSATCSTRRRSRRSTRAPSTSFVRGYTVPRSGSASSSRISGATWPRCAVVVSGRARARAGAAVNPRAEL